jgi:hypothetical protein
MGGAISKCGDTVDEVIYIQSPVAAAASTVLYSLQYGDGGGNGDDSADSIESPSGKADCDEDYVDEDDDYILGRLIFSDDEDFLVGVDSEEDECLRSSFPKDRTRKTIILGGPQPLDLSNYPESEFSSIWGKYVKARKKYVDDERHKRLKAKKSTTKGGGLLSGDQPEQLRPMSEVENKARLSVGDIFRSKDVVFLRIAEEANLRGISTRVQQSDVMNLTVVGINFYVHATVYENVGWCIHAAVCRECDDTLKIPPRDRVDLSVVASKKGYVRIPIKSKMIVPIISNDTTD